MSKDRRSYVEEMALAIGKALAANHDRNPNRMAQVNGWLNYGHEVAIARRGRNKNKYPIPPRPNEKFI